VVKVRVPAAGPGELYSRGSLIPQPDGTPSMPSPVAPQVGPVSDISRVDSIFNLDGMNSVGATALMTPRGGAMSSPKQQADREIKRLIRRLD
jgi:hypothetical protein